MMMVPSISLILTTLTCSGNKIGKLIEISEKTVMVTTADLLNLITGMVLNNADNHGSAEELECAKEVDAALDMMDVNNLHFQCKLQDFCQIAEMYVKYSV
jgi:hypothetical protein